MAIASEHTFWAHRFGKCSEVELGLVVSELHTAHACVGVPVKVSRDLALKLTVMSGVVG